MDNPLICVFTPTYNRSALLTRCYKSLICQTNKNFIWQIIDDGSTDDTCEMVKQWIKENIINIEYIYKENGGKIRAIEQSVRTATNDLWMCLDSDDYLFDNAIEIIEKTYNLIKQDDSICGMITVRSDDNKKPMQGERYINKIKKIPKIVKFMEYRYKYSVPPEYTLVYKLKMIKEYKYPDYCEEKFMPESSVYCLMDKKYDLLKIDDAIMYSEQLQNGITLNHKKIVKDNPKGYTYTHAIIADNANTIRCFFHSAICYQMGRTLGGDKYIFSGIKSVIIFLFYPIGFCARFIRYGWKVK